MKTMAERFWPKVQKTKTCWWWTGAEVKGYGIIDIGGRKDKKRLKAHRVACELAGLKVKGLIARHECNNKLCVRVDIGHVQVGTQKQNMRDRELAGNTLRGSRATNAVMTKERAKQVITFHNTGQYSTRKLAEIFNLSKSTIFALVSGTTAYGRELEIIPIHRSRSFAAAGEQNSQYKHGEYIGSKTREVKNYGRNN